MKNRTHTSLLILFLFGLSSCSGKQNLEFIPLSVLLKDQATPALIKAERFDDALNIYISMLESVPDKPQVHSNIGVMMSQLKKSEEALKSLKHALNLAIEQKDLKHQFALNYNLGVYYGAEKKIAEALNYYQAALDLNPTSKETKTNIELLIQSENKNGKGDGENQQQDQKNEKSDSQNQSQNQNDQDNKDKKDAQKDQKDGKNDNKENDKDKDQQKDKQSERKSSPKYKPRPYQGDQLSEGDVKKILGELRNQEQKIRANFDKKERQKDSGHDKDW